MKVLLVGGTGIISTAVSQEIIEREYDLYVLNRGNHPEKLPNEATLLKGDINDKKQVKALLEDNYFDVIVDFIAFTVEHCERDYELFNGKTDQFIFISSASAYKKPLPFTPVTEAIPLGNKYWGYSENKKKCETYLFNTPKDFNVTVIRPSHTYNEKMLIARLNSHSNPYTLLNRFIQGKEIILINGGSQVWTITHNSDFAKGFVDVFKNEAAYNDYFHLTSEKAYTWRELNQHIYEALNEKKAIPSPKFVSIPIETVMEYFPEFKAEIYGDKLTSTTFDNSKIKAIAPNYSSKVGYEDILPKVIDHFLNNTDQAIDEEFDKKYDALIAYHKKQ
ncbi:MAG: NAD-dependent epimerase/dehydratase family protein [Candidatus Izimaplasma sp.]|nr:NAD-dependent epimerase/dehydratase family protein [Candidatus Izimaplasma bacterium]